MHTIDVARHILFERRIAGVLEQEAAGLGLPVGEKDEDIFTHPPRPEVFRIVIPEAMLRALQVFGIPGLPVCLKQGEHRLTCVKLFALIGQVVEVDLVRAMGFLDQREQLAPVQKTP